SIIRYILVQDQRVAHHKKPVMARHFGKLVKHRYA
ncbi:MAG: hypothetical protein ACI8VW_004246, partial [bacterium]